MPQPVAMCVLTTSAATQLCKSTTDRVDFRFYLSAGAPIIAQWQCPYFWLTILPATSQTSGAINYALLAMSATTQQILGTPAAVDQPVASRGDKYYGQACSLLRTGTHVTLEEALSASFALWSYDWFSGRQLQSFVHVRAAVRLFQSLESHDTTSKPTELTRGSRCSMLEVAEAFFRDTHFPMRNLEFLRMLERRGRTETGAVSTCDVIQINATEQTVAVSENPFAELATPEDINSFFWLIVVADSKQALLVIQEALDQCAYQLAHDISPRSRSQETFQNQIRLCQLFCQTHLSDSDDHFQKDNNDLKMSQMMDLIQDNMQLIANEKASSRSNQQNTATSSLSQQGIHCYLGILGHIGQKAQNHDVRLRAFSQIAYHGTPKAVSSSKGALERP